MKHITTKHRWVVLLWHVFVAMLVMSLCRVVYYWQNIDAFAHLDMGQLMTAFIGGMRFDGAALGYAGSLYLVLLLIGGFLPARIENHSVYKILRAIAYLVPMLIAVFVNISDAGYYPFGLKRTTMSVFTEFQNESALDLYSRFVVDYWHLATAFVLLIGILVWGYCKVRLNTTMESWGWRRVFVTLGQTLVVAVVTLFTIRGHLKIFDRPMTVMVANNYVDDAADRALVLNTLFTMIRTSQHNTLLEYHFMPAEEIAQHYDVHYTAAPLHEGDSLFGAFKGRNVVLISLESFDREYTGYLNRHLPNYPSYTPFLDSLMQQSVTFEYAFANGRISVEALPSALTSLPALNNSFVLSHYSGNRITGLPRILEESSGYHSCFYHGAHRGSMAFDAFMKQIGTDDFYCREEYGQEEHYDGAWGIFDHYFLPKAAQEMARKPEPFLATIFTLSSHNPYTVPNDYKGRVLEGPHKLHATVNYADAALRLFFDEIRRAPWFQNTLFVLMADHASITTQEVYNTLPGRYSIPLMIYDPQGRLQPALHGDIVVQQADILPTLLYLLGDTTPVLSFGSNLFDPDAPHFAVTGDNEAYTLFHRDLTLSMTKEGVVTTLPAPSFGNSDDDKRIPDALTLERYQRLLPALVQDYNYRVIHNQLLP